MDLMEGGQLCFNLFSVGIWRLKSIPAQKEQNLTCINKRQIIMSIVDPHTKRVKQI